MALGHDGLLHEVLGLLANLFSDCPPAQKAFASSGNPSLLQRTLNLVFKPSLDLPTFQVQVHTSHFCVQSGISVKHGQVHTCCCGMICECETSQEHSASHTYIVSNFALHVPVSSCSTATMPALTQSTTISSLLHHSCPLAQLYVVMAADGHTPQPPNPIILG